MELSLHRSSLLTLHHRSSNRASRRATREQAERHIEELRAFATANLRPLEAVEARAHSLPLPPLLANATTLYTLRDMLSPALCERVISEAQRVGFAQSPHLAANTVLQVSVHRSTNLLAIFHAVYEALRPFVRARYDAELVRWEDPTSVPQFRAACNDAFVSQYVAGPKYAGISLHRDAEDFAFVAQLNARDFYGGGTFYPHYGPHTTQLAQGDLGVHPGFVLHGGAPITSGERFILAGFLKVEARAPSGRTLHPLRTVDARARAIEASLQVSAEADVALARLFVGVP